VEQGKLDMKEALLHADSKNDLSLRFRLDGMGSRSKIKVDVAYSKSADFSHYHTYRIKQVNIDQKFSDRAELIENSIRNAMKKKGLQESQIGADIEIQYVFIPQPSAGKKLKEIKNPISSGIDINPELQEHGLLRVTLVDLEKKKPIWQVSASREIAAQPRPQADMNKDADYLFSEFPPASLQN